ncbi:DUF3817 domain-containing protein [Aestuariimicrobium sp. p3-SID1156]|uniref:DUF3817 domain-containing protein n=1 Tax=Aestuariimicrobium sp. p3-SID1156 TaxID=2916038 RepID=UPI00223C426E|nr:DUF3817 domain-containing protein [Aestuariimicrobium sp. p3-SID1156]MCT1458046.1 DUF3817 domain-containing protein [Aestuariimicrobium sp. p3-SID1156]
MTSPHQAQHPVDPERPLEADPAQAAVDPLPAGAEETAPPQVVSEDSIVADDLEGIRGALTRYRIMAWVVGTLLVVLVCIGMPLKYLWNDDRVVTWTGVPHGWLYMLLIITAVDLGRRVRWSWTRLALIALAGTVPFLSFVAEHSATKDVRAKIAKLERDGIA